MAEGPPVEGSEIMNGHDLFEREVRDLNLYSRVHLSNHIHIHNYKVLYL